MSEATVIQMRRLTDFQPVHYVVSMIQDMPLPSAGELQKIVTALSNRLHDEDARRFEAVIDCLGDVSVTLEDCVPAGSDCDWCAGSGVNRHNGSRCIACLGRGVLA